MCAFLNDKVLFNRSVSTEILFPFFLLMAKKLGKYFKKVGKVFRGVILYKIH